MITEDDDVEEMFSKKAKHTADIGEEYRAKVR